MWRLNPDTTIRGPIGPYAERMAAALTHRGPDDAGLWEDATADMALSHRRLSIIDLSPEGHQPMASPCGRYVIVFNGEIYNFRALRRELAKLGCLFRGHSDTEVLLAAIVQWGLDNALRRLNGMFAFALWDRRMHCLHLARDRLGKKPLYFGWIGGTFAFASELKAFRVLDAFPGKLNRDAISLYLRFGYIPAPWCIYQGFYKLRQGSILSFDRQQGRAPFNPAQCVRAYWSAAEIAQAGIDNPLDSNEQHTIDLLQQLLEDATAQRMAADVPIGAFLSGGVDSSLIVSLMQAQSATPVKTYALGFGDGTNSETPYARAIASYLGTDHTELHLTGKDAIDTVPELPDIVDEPLADFAQVPNYLIARMARPHAKVVLTGDGGDELFCGYSRFNATAHQWRNLQRVPRPVRKLAAVVLSCRSWPAGEQNKWMKSALRIGARSVDALYFQKVSQWLYPSALLIGAREPSTTFPDGGKWPGITDPVLRTLLLDLTHYLAEVILVKVDRTSMANGLEVRSPLLDYRVVEWSWHLPRHMKTRDRQGKWILRELLARYLPRPLFERPKQGFGAPIGQWLAGPLRGWAEDLLAPERLRRQGLFNPEPVRRVWTTRSSDSRQWQHRIWNLLMLQAWLDREASSVPRSSGDAEHRVSDAV
ncbi:MAG: asparagine synthase (glutamine-hydrolyzing) [Nitrococcus mobilis]|nr:asparagine synthase (glutamine-hydrolyzing) [Nitrococcus mobilis]